MRVLWTKQEVVQIVLAAVVTVGISLYFAPEFFYGLHCCKEFDPDPVKGGVQTWNNVYALFWIRIVFLYFPVLVLILLTHWSVLTVKKIVKILH